MFKYLFIYRDIQHPNSVSLYGAVDDSGKVGYVMEYCPNGSLYLLLGDAGTQLLGGEVGEYNEQFPYLLSKSEGG